MAAEVVPLQPEQIDELSGFLTRGFETPADAEFAAPDVLRWKYLEPREDDDGPRSYVAMDGGRIVGHVGIDFTSFHVLDGATPPREVRAHHMMDWLGSPEHRGAGIALMRRAFSQTEAQYLLGGTEAARRVFDAVGFETLTPLPVYQRVIRPGHRLRASGEGLPKRAARMARDLVRNARNQGKRPETAIELRPVDAFGGEAQQVLDACEPPLIHASRGPARLNTLLRYPRRNIRGYLLVSSGEVRGFALLSVVRLGKVRVGKVVECFLAERSPAPWHAASAALLNELGRLGADLAQACGSTPWAEAALRAAGFDPAYPWEFRLRDRGALLPRGLPFHVTFLEADYSHTA